MYLWIPSRCGVGIRFMDLDSSIRIGHLTGHNRTICLIRWRIEANNASIGESSLMRRLQIAAWGFGITAALILWFICPLFSQNQDAIPTFRAQANLVTVSFHVVQKGAYLRDLKREDIVLLEDGSPRPVSFFEGGRIGSRKIPVEIAILLDASKIGPSSVFNYRFLEGAHASTLRSLLSRLLEDVPNMRLTIYRFAADSAGKSTELRRLCRPSRDVAELCLAFVRLLLADPGGERILMVLPPGRKLVPDAQRSSAVGRPAWVYESIIATLNDWANTGTNCNRMLLTFANGLSPTSTLPADAVAPATALSVSVYPVMIAHQLLVTQYTDYRSKMETWNAGGRIDLDRYDPLVRMQQTLKEMEQYGWLGELTGGNSFDYNIIGIDEMRQILVKMWAEAESAYTAGFACDPTPGAPKRHKLEVRLASEASGKISGGKRTVLY